MKRSQQDGHEENEKLSKRLKSDSVVASTTLSSTLQNPLSLSAVFSNDVEEVKVGEKEDLSLMVEDEDDDKTEDPPEEQKEEEEKEEKEEKEEEEEEEIDISPIQNIDEILEARSNRAKKEVKTATLNPPPTRFANVQRFSVFIVEGNQQETWRNAFRQTMEEKSLDSRLWHGFLNDSQTKRRVTQRHKSQFSDLDWIAINNASCLVRIPIPFIKEIDAQNSSTSSSSSEQRTGKEYVYIILIAANLLRRITLVASNLTVAKQTVQDRAYVLRRCGFLHAALEEKSRFIYVGNHPSLLKGIETLGEETSTCRNKVDSKAFCSIRNSSAQDFVSKYRSFPALLLAESERASNSSALRCFLSANHNLNNAARNESNRIVQDGEPRTTSMDFIEEHIGGIARNNLLADQVVLFNDILSQFQQSPACDCSMPIDTTRNRVQIDACQFAFSLFHLHRLCTLHAESAVSTLRNQLYPIPSPLPPVSSSSSSSSFLPRSSLLSQPLRQPHQIPGFYHPSATRLPPNLSSTVARLRELAVAMQPLNTFGSYSSGRRNNEEEDVEEEEEEEDDDDVIIQNPTRLNRTYYNPLRRHDSKKEKKEEKKEKKSLDEEAGPNDAQCVICLTNRARYATVPCGHLCMCGQCRRDLKHAGNLSKCPLCKGTAKSTVCIYIPMKGASNDCEQKGVEKEEKTVEKAAENEERVIEEEKDVLE